MSVNAETSLSTEQLQSLLYEQGLNVRFTQDTPVLPDVWAEYARHPGRPVDLLLTPYQKGGSSTLSPAVLAAKLDSRLKTKAARAPGFQRTGDGMHEIAVNQTTVAVRLWFDELVRVVLPLSAWWQSNLVRVKADQALVGQAARALKLVRTPSGRNTLAALFAGSSHAHPAELGPDLFWMMQVVGAIALANQPQKPRRGRGQADAVDAWPPPATGAPRRRFFLRMLEALAQLFAGSGFEMPAEPLVHLVSRNRKATTCLHRSVAAVKADAARSVFQIDCSSLTWAVVDSGIDATHPAFRQRQPDGRLVKLNRNADWGTASRVASTYDFTLVRRLLSTDDTDVAALPPRLRQIVKRSPQRRKEIRERLLNGREVDWPLLLPFLEVPHDGRYTPPAHDHGTHVAGILAADWRLEEDETGRLDVSIVGMCPTLNLIDVRILDDLGDGDEFGVMAALQFLRYLNSHKDFMVVQGANLSLSILHDVANYACGRTPVCEECERLVAAGVVTVAAAGNDGFKRQDFGAKGGDYASISITDPGNAEGVITVGSTHRDMPHTYGVSYFSSRGPTGDGRCKPDLVAPGEKIDSTAPNGELVRKDGTSMAAPHVSGAAALLLARHREFIGQPRRVKTVLCRTATDLGRERYFQGSGMLDVLRALQEV